MTVRPRTSRGAAVEALAPRQLVRLLGGDGVDHAVRDVQSAHDVLVQHAHAARGDGAHRQLLVAGNAQLAHEEDVERRAERLGHLGRDGHAAARQREHQHVRSVGVRPELRGEQATRVATIPKS